MFYLSRYTKIHIISRKNTKSSMLQYRVTTYIKGIFKYNKSELNQMQNTYNKFHEKVSNVLPLTGNQKKRQGLKKATCYKQIL